MNKTFISLLFLVITLGGLLAFQATKETSASVLLPSEINATTSGKRLRVVGKVVENSINYQVQPALKLSFQITNPEIANKETSITIKPLSVIYEGVKPDMFSAGRQVIIDGAINFEGIFLARELLTQCPSKYEPPKPDSTNSK